ncbi:MAG: hypothetical protein SOI56_09265 [Eubacteriales bacterium]|jgi:hypothetical protein
MKNTHILMTALLCGFCFTMAACGTDEMAVSSSAAVSASSTSSFGEELEDASTESVETVSTESTSSVPEEQIPEGLNEKAEGENVFRIFLTNRTGSTITGFAVKKASDSGETSEYSNNLITSGDTFADQQRRTLYFDTMSYLNETNTASSTSSSEKLTYPDYDVQITLEDGTTYEIHSFPFAQAEEFSICLQDDTAYAEYVDSLDGSTVSTLADA